MLSRVWRRLANAALFEDFDLHQYVYDAASFSPFDTAPVPRHDVPADVWLDAARIGKKSRNTLVSEENSIDQALHQQGLVLREVSHDFSDTRDAGLRLGNDSDYDEEDGESDLKKHWRMGNALSVPRSRDSSALISRSHSRDERNVQLWPDFSPVAGKQVDEAAALLSYSTPLPPVGMFSGTLETVVTDGEGLDAVAMVPSVGGVSVSAVAAAMIGRADDDNAGGGAPASPFALSIGAGNANNATAEATTRSYLTASGSTLRRRSRSHTPGTRTPADLDGIAPTEEEALFASEEYITADRVLDGYSRHSRDRSSSPHTRHQSMSAKTITVQCMVESSASDLVRSDLAKTEPIMRNTTVDSEENTYNFTLRSVTSVAAELDLIGDSHSRIADDEVGYSFETNGYRLSESVPLVVISPLAQLRDELIAENDCSSAPATVTVLAMTYDEMQLALRELRNQGSSNVRYAALSFLLLWAGFNTVQGLIISVDKDLGSAVLALYYSAFVLASPFVPALLARAAGITIMRAAFLVFSCFIAAFIYPVTWIILILTSLVGATGAVMWAAQSVYANENSDESTLMTNVGTFSAVVQLNSLVSSLGSALLLSFTDATLAVVFTLATAIALVATLLVFRLQPPAFTGSTEAISAKSATSGVADGVQSEEAVELQLSVPVVEGFVEHLEDQASNLVAIDHDCVDLDEEDNGADFATREIHAGLLGRPFETETTDQLRQSNIISNTSSQDCSVASARPARSISKTSSFSVLRDVFLLFSLFRERNALLILSTYLVSGVFYAFLYGPLARLLPLNLVGFGLGAYGLSSVIASLSFSRFVASKRLSPMQVVLVGVTTHSVGLCFTAAAGWQALKGDDPSNAGHVFIVLTTYVLIGITNGTAQTMLVGLVPALFPVNVGVGYTFYRVVQSMGMACTHLLVRLVGVTALHLVAIQVFLMVLSAFGLSRVNREIFQQPRYELVERNKDR